MCSSVSLMKLFFVSRETLLLSFNNRMHVFCHSSASFPESSEGHDAKEELWAKTGSCGVRSRAGRVQSGELGRLCRCRVRSWPWQDAGGRLLTVCGRVYSVSLTEAAHIKALCGAPCWPESLLHILQRLAQTAPVQHRHH